jgi:hypothetical protein
LRRRRASTARPAFDRILTRKPCVRLRRRRFGWNVLFIASCLPPHDGAMPVEAKSTMLLRSIGSVNSRPFPPLENFFLSTNTPYARLRASSGRHRRYAFHRGGVPRTAGFPHLLIFLWKTRVVRPRAPLGQPLSTASKCLWCR